MTKVLLVALLLAETTLAGCGEGASQKIAQGEQSTVAPVKQALAAIDAGTKSGFRLEQIGRFREPWALALIPGTDQALVTERGGKLKLWSSRGAVSDVTGVPPVDYGDDGGLGDIALAPDFAKTGTVYLSWSEHGDGDKRGAAVGRAKLVQGDAPRLEGLEVIWRQQPKDAGWGHHSHRIAFSPDGAFLFVSSGDRRLMTPAQRLDNNLGKIVRLLPDGRPAPGNPFADKGGIAAEVWTLGHRNVLGLKFDEQRRLWDLEHGPAGGDELNLVKPGQNYGWPVVSDGDHYDGTPIPRHRTNPKFAAPAISWNPVIAPGDFIFYRGAMFPEWRGQAIIAGLRSQALVRVVIEGESAREVARHPMPNRVREIVEAPDGALLILEDGPGARLLRLIPAKR